MVMHTSTHSSVVAKEAMSFSVSPLSSFLRSTFNTSIST